MGTPRYGSPLWASAKKLSGAVQAACLAVALLAAGCSSDESQDPAPAGSGGAQNQDGDARDGGTHVGGAVNAAGSSNPAGAAQGGNSITGGQGGGGRPDGGIGSDPDGGANQGDDSDGGVPGGGPGGDGGNPEERPSVEECLGEAVVGETRTERLDFTGEGLSFGIVRVVDPDAFGTSGTTVWLPERLAIQRGAEAACVSAPAELGYTVSHHNFDDVMTAAGSDVVWTFRQQREGYDFPTTWTIEAAEGETLLWGPLPLILASCQELNTEESCAARYQ